MDFRTRLDIQRVTLHRLIGFKMLQKMHYYADSSLSLLLRLPSFILNTVYIGGNLHFIV